MEEKRTNDAATAQSKLSYEQLENTAHQLSEQCRQLYNQNKQLSSALEAANTANFFKKLDYLWLVITKDTEYLSRDFKIKCGEEFMALMTPEPEEVKK